MLAADRLTLAIDIHAQAYELLQWVATAVRKGFIPATRAHEYANTGDAALAWMQDHYLNFPHGMRPERRHLREFANYFGTYVTSSFDIVEQPGNLLVSRCGCYCPLCAHLASAPHLRARRPTRRDKVRAEHLMVHRVAALAREEGIDVAEPAVVAIVRGETRRSTAYSTYGHWLIRRLEGDTDGTAVLALWREIAWKRTGSPIKDFRLEYKDFLAAEKLVADALRSANAIEASQSQNPSGTREASMERRVTGFHQDEEGHWVAELECGHNQHVRHDPPWESRPWVVTADGRRGRLGIQLNCVKCDRGLPPDRSG